MRFSARRLHVLAALAATPALLAASASAATFLHLDAATGLARQHDALFSVHAHDCTRSRADAVGDGQGLLHLARASACNRSLRGR